MKIIRGKDINFVPASHEDKKNPQVLKKVLLKRDDLINGRVQMINWAKLPLGKTFKAHYHEDMEEIFIILNGKTRITIDKETEELNEGDTVIVPIKEIHMMENISPFDVNYIAIGISLCNNGKTVISEK